MNKSKSTFLLLSAVLLLTFLSFRQVLHFEFINWDDDVHVYLNPHIFSFNWQSLTNIFHSTVNQTYIPLTILSFSLEHYFFGFNPTVFHAVNLLLHLAVVSLVFLFCLEFGLGRVAAFGAALIFAVHPMHVESVAWVTARKDVLYSLFYLSALIVYLRYIKTSQKKFFYWSIVFGLLSMLSKPMALSLPLVMFLLDWYFRRPVNKNLFYEKIPHFIYVIGLAFVTYYTHARIPGESLLQGILVWFWTLTFYLNKFFWPMTLVPLYQLPKPVSFLSVSYGMALASAVGYLFLLFRFRNNRMLLFAFGYFFLSIFFLLRFDDVLDRTIVADRFMYLPSLGFCLGAGVLLEWAWQQPRTFASKLMIGLFILAAVGAVFKTYQQTLIWRDSLTLWNYVVKYTPNAIAYSNRGNVLAAKDKMDLALVDFNRAISSDPKHAIAYNSRGAVYYKQGEFDLARQDFIKTIELNKDMDDAYSNLGLIYLKEKKYDLAIQYFQKAVAIRPESMESYINAAIAFEMRNDFASALKQYEAALKINPGYDQAFYNRGMTYLKMGRDESALNEFNQALKVNPKMAKAYFYRGEVYAKMEKHQKAYEDFDSAWKAEPNYNEALARKAGEAYLAGNYAAALRDIEELMALEPENSNLVLAKEQILQAQKTNEGK